MKEGVSFMSADRAALKDNVLHFEHLGVSVLELTSEEAKNLANQEGVLAVEEDAKIRCRLRARGLHQPEGNGKVGRNTGDY